MPLPVETLALELKEIKVARLWLAGKARCSGRIQGDLYLAGPRVEWGIRRHDASGVVAWGYPFLPGIDSEGTNGHHIKGDDECLDLNQKWEEVRVHPDHGNHYKVESVYPHGNRVGDYPFDGGLDASDYR